MEHSERMTGAVLVCWDHQQTVVATNKNEDEVDGNGNGKVELSRPTYS